MNGLRLVLLLIGIVVIAVIYFRETLKQKQLQRKQTVSSEHTESDILDLKISPALDDDSASKEYSSTISDLSRSVANTKNENIGLESEAVFIDAPSVDDDVQSQALPETQDLFMGSEQDVRAQDEQGDSDSIESKDEQIITLHITALPVQIFKGNDILDAVNNVGMEYGEMNIFHHYGIGDMQGEQPLFSLSDMFEPGNFDIDKIDSHSTRGLSLFICLSNYVDGQVVFELMLNTAQRLSELLEGELRGADHNLLNDQQIAKMRQSIIEQAQ